MARIEPDGVIGRAAQPEDGERVIAVFQADRMAYWRSHLVMAVVLGAFAGLFLMWQGNPWPVAGPLGAVLAIGIRAAYLASEALADRWTLTERRLIGPGGRILPIAALKSARPFLDAVQVVTLSGEKHLIKYLADPALVARQITDARTR